MSKLFSTDGEQYDDALVSLGGAMFRSSQHHGFTAMSSAIETILGYPASHWTANPNFFVDTIDPADRERVLQFCESLKLTPRTPRSIEFRMRAADGRLVWVRSVAEATKDGADSKFFGVMFDATHLHQEAVLNAQEEERHRLSRELHDDINQRIAMVAVDLDRLRTRTAAGEGASSAELTKIWNAVKDVSNDLHGLAVELRCDPVTRHGLPGALRHLCASLANQSPIRISSDDIESRTHDLTEAASVALYRVAQEALFNAIRHSRAKVIAVRFRNQQSNVVLEVVDDGIGVDADRDERDDKLGITSMRERIELVGGKLSIVASFGSGTRVRAEVAAAPPSVEH